jgi:hypothetical protein
VKHSDLFADLIAAQTHLIEALDARLPDDIVAASANLADSVAKLKARAAEPIGTNSTAMIEHAIKQTDAARMRVNILSDWNRQRIDKLAELRGGKPRLAYTRDAHG